MSLKFTHLQPIDRLKYFVERQLVKGAGYQLFVIVACIAFISLAGGLLISPINFDGRALSEDVWWAFLRLTDPGYLGDDEGAWRRIVSTVLTICGYVLFMGTLVAIMTRWLIAFMEKLEQGLTPVSVKNHVVVLGETSRTVPIIHELLGNEDNRNYFKKLNHDKDLSIILLAETVNAIIHQQLLAELNMPLKLSKRLVLRSGKALQLEALHRAACTRASAIILPSQYQRSDSPITSDVETIKSLLSLDVLADSTGLKPRVVVELDDARHAKLARKSYQGGLSTIATDETISRLIAQCAVVPSLLKVYSYLMTSADGAQFYFKTAEPFSGMSIMHVKQLHQQAILVGYINMQSNVFELSVGESAFHKLSGSDILVFISKNFQQIEQVTELSKLTENKLVKPVAHKAPTVKSAPKRMLLLGWNRRVPAIIAELDSYIDESFDVTLVSSLAKERRQTEIEKLGALSSRTIVSYQEADYMVESEVKALTPEDYDIVMLLYSDRLDSAEEADARVLVGSMVLDEVLSNAQKQPHVLIELSDPSNESFLDDSDWDTFITPLIMSHMLSQVALMPQSQILFDSLMKAGGIQIRLHPLSYYTDKEMLKLEQLTALAEQQGELVIGVIREENGADQVKLNLDKSARFSRLAGDQVVVIGNEINSRKT
ncbi:hypothetical protein N7931_05035 [Catenovulum sp. 2E275]|uniref:CASTOR/POLLUX-related putative ion channel n=1 Tax=Catenovulum sp. 2E275 TaxID=2980497 RepID=UPI0021D3E2DF|nr:hypothetical protein [Catenovulum sp. 2E275]MCU4674993.1 hypothetical protein [Catenovulum sp. 2E275]